MGGWRGDVCDVEGDGGYGGDKGGCGDYQERKERRNLVSPSFPPGVGLLSSSFLLFLFGLPVELEAVMGVVVIAVFGELRG
jgi:hypothetical protein